MPSQCPGSVSKQLDTPCKRRAPFPPSSARLHAGESDSHAIELRRPCICYLCVIVYFRLIVHVISDSTRKLFGVSDIESPECSVYSAQKQRLGVVSEKCPVYRGFRSIGVRFNETHL